MRRVLGIVFLLTAVFSCTHLDAVEHTEAIHVLIVNDDGVEAPGIAALAAELARNPSFRVTIVAPAEHQSAKGHAITIRQEVRVSPRPALAGCPTWAVAATPATTVRIGVAALLAEDPPDIVVSGINSGENVGRIAWYSGTVGAAREAALSGFPAIAFSLQLDWDDPHPDFETAARWAVPVISAVNEHGLPPDTYLNVNIPLDPSAAKGYRLASSGLGADAENRYEVARTEGEARWYRSRWRPNRSDRRGTDNHGLAEGWVVITPLTLDQTKHSAFADLLSLEVALPTVPTE